MTKQELQKELQEKVKEGIKPSDIKRLKRSKSEGDIPNPPPPPLNSELIALKQENTELKKQITELKQQEIFVEALEESQAELKQKISELTDQILELRLANIKDFGNYRESLSELTQELNLDEQEITKLEQRVQTLIKERNRLDNDQLLTARNNSDWWTDYGPLISVLLVYLVSIWLISKNQAKKV